MKPGIELEGKRVLVVGLARTGVATALFCAARGARVTATEERAEPQIGETRGETCAPPACTLEFGGHGRETFLRAGSDRAQPRRAADACRLWPPRAPRAFRCGAKSNWPGASCAAAWCASPARTARPRPPRWSATFWKPRGLPVQVAGNIGTPLISRVDESSDASFTVVEVSSFQLELIDPRCGRTSPCCSISRPTISTATARSKPTAAPRRASSKIRPRATPPCSTRTMPWRRNMRPRGREYSGSAARSAWPAGASLRDDQIVFRRDGDGNRRCFAAPISACAASTTSKMFWPRPLRRRLAGVEPAAIAAGRAHFRRRGAPPRVRRRDLRRRIFQRFQGHQRGRHAQGARGVSRRRAGDSRRQG